MLIVDAQVHIWANHALGRAQQGERSGKILVARNGPIAG
jgi:hypothetical protein